jgi:hypothetical protein
MILTRPFALIVGHYPDTPAEFIGTFGSEREATDEGRRIAESRVAGHTRNALTPPCFEVFDLRHPGPARGSKIHLDGSVKYWPSRLPKVSAWDVEAITEVMASAVKAIDGGGMG